MNTNLPYKVLAFAFGVSSFIVQLVLMREFMNLFSGNELVIGLMLALWMSATALGAWAGRFLSKSFLHRWETIPVIMMQGLAPLAGIFLAVWMRTVVYAPGEMVSLQGVILICLSGILLFCTLSGMMFSILASAVADSAGKAGIPITYSIEAAGSLVGGLIFNLFLVNRSGGMHLLAYIAIMNGILAIWYAFRLKRAAMAAVSLLFTLVLILMAYLYDGDELMAGLQHPGQHIITTEDTPYGRITLTEDGGQYNLFMHGMAAISSDDPVRREEKVHYPMALHPAPKDVLMIFGGVDGAIAEAQKYGDIRLIYAEPEYNWLKPTASTFSNSLLKEFGIVNADPRRFLARTNGRFDVIMVNAAAPSTIGNNRFFTAEFFRIAHKTLKENGILSIRVPAAGNYLDKNIRAVYSSIYNSLKSSFLNIRLVPGEEYFFLASDHPILGDITQKIREKNISTTYVNEWYLDDHLLNSRAGTIMKQLDEDAPLNTDQHPLAAFSGMLRWIGIFHVPFWLIVLIPLLIIIFFVYVLKPVNTALFATGFTASSAEFILLIAFQLAYGFVYQMAGYVIMFFMLGLALGAGILHRIMKIGETSFLYLQGIIGISVIIVPLALYIMPRESLLFWLPGAVICLMTFVLAALTGIQYRLASMLLEGSGLKTASATYGADLAGSSIGIFFTAAVIYPLVGLLFTCLLLGILNILVVVYLKWRMK